MTLNAEQIREFFEVGFVVLPNLFKLEEVGRISQALERLQRKAMTLSGTTVINGTQYVVENGQIKRVVWAGGEESVLLDYGSDPRVIGPVSTLLGSESMVQLICQAHYKIPGDQVDFTWHQDSEHRRYGTPEWRDVNGRGSYVQTLLAVDEVTLDNGPVKFVRNSCRRGHLGLDKVADKNQYINSEQIVAPTLKPGSLVMFGPYVIHGSEPNNSNLPRRVFINGFCAPGANSRLYPGCGKGRHLTLQR